MRRPTGSFVLGWGLLFATACGGDADRVALDAAVDGGSAPFDGGAGDPDGGSCVPTAEAEVACDDVDDDCNGLVDDLDDGGDGITDCLAILLLGNPGTLGASNFLAWLEEQGTAVDRTLTSAAETVGAETLTAYDVVIVDRLPRALDATEAGALGDFVRAGGGLVSMAGYTGSDGPSQSSALVELGVAYTGSVLSGPVTTFEAHPTTEGLTSVTFQGGFVLTTTPVDGATSTPVASLTAGPVAIAHEQGLGRAFVWGDEWVQFDSQWSTMPELPRFWGNVLGWVAGFR